MNSARSRLGFLLVFAVFAVLALGACSSKHATVIPKGGAGGDDSGDAGVVDAGGLGVLPVGGGPEVSHTLSLSPGDTTLTLTGEPQTLQLTAALDGKPISTVNWSLDDVLFGVIDTSGSFHAFGDRAGAVTVTARVGSLTATAKITLLAVIVDNGAALADDVMTSLRTGGAAEAQFSWLYPYEGTVFPEGLGAPLMQFAGAAADALYVRVTFTNFTYEGFYAAAEPSPQEIAAGIGSDKSKWPLRVALSDRAWNAIVKSTKGTEDITVSVTKLTGSKVSGPLTRHWRIADGELQGTVYYNTYNSGLPDVGGAVMRVPLGGSFEPVMGLRGCTVCHSVSANGKVIAAAIGYSEEPAGKNSGNPVESASFDLSETGGATERRRETTDGRKFAFGGLTPDGTWMMTNGVPDVALDAPRVRGLSGYDPDKTDDFVIVPQPSRLIETMTGAVVDLPSFSDRVTLALTPQFAPDGSALAFSWYDDSPGRTLGLVRFHGDRSPPSVDAPQAVLRSNSEVLAWPSFTPDAKGLVFHAGDGFDTNLHGGGAAYAQIRLLDLDGNIANTLDAVNGIDSKGAAYLPLAEPGLERDVKDQALMQGTTHMNYEPNVLPVAIGGYYWVFFTSRRTYGNVIAPDGALPLSNKPFGTADPSPRKKIWVAAIDIDFHGKHDPSHPAFYLPGQELGSGNMRAFAALAPCRANGASCTSGVQCCDGFCRPTASGDETPDLQCVPPPKDSCANENEVCSTAADCCNIEYLCINKRCAQLTPD